VNLLNKIRPYGDTLNDGKVQVSFTLPIEKSEIGDEAAKQVAQKMGLTSPELVHSASLDDNYSFYIIYGSFTKSIDISKINVNKIDAPKMDFYQINDYIKKYLGRKIVVVGACTGSDAHTVGLDAIMNMKGYAGEYGLERYPEIEALNLGSQVENYKLIEKAKELNADAILISQVVTQKDVHIKNLTEFIEMAHAEKLEKSCLLIIGGPRISNELAAELGFDAGFGRGSLPPDVASYIATELVKRKIEK
jgi:beta-lysine 5,6-aminomutase beta subunit